MKKADVIAELRRVAGSLQDTRVSRSSYQKHGAISSAAVEKTFGSWNEAILAAGLTPLPQGGRLKGEERGRERITEPPTAGYGSARIADEELLEELLRLARELGRRPSGNQISAKGKYEATVYQRRWGSVAAAYETALSREASKPAADNRSQEVRCCAIVPRGVVPAHHRAFRGR